MRREELRNLETHPLTKAELARINAHQTPPGYGQGRVLAPFVNCNEAGGRSESRTFADGCYSTRNPRPV